MNGAIFMYHRIASLVPDCHELCTPPDGFRDQLTRLARAHRVLPLEELCARAASDAWGAAGASGPSLEGAVALTFDDGTLDSFAAAEILGELGLPATFFVMTERLDEPHETWWDILERLFVAEGDLPPRLLLEGFSLPTGTRDERLRAHQQVRARVLAQSADERDACIEAVMTWSGRTLAPRDSHRLLLREEVAELARRPGCTVGAHSIHHLMLSTRPVAEQRQEIVGSRDDLARTLGAVPTSFAYPFGALSADTVALAAEAGFACAVTTEARTVGARESALRLPRVGSPRLYGDAFSAFVARLFEAR
jgi:peptidoglycan/xylan/chitin deacetylase (PgdA/CDA1 family)